MSNPYSLYLSVSKDRLEIMCHEGALPKDQDRRLAINRLMDDADCCRTHYQVLQLLEAIGEQENRHLFNFYERLNLAGNRNNDVVEQTDHNIRKCGLEALMDQVQAQIPAGWRRVQVVRIYA